MNIFIQYYSSSFLVAVETNLNETLEENMILKSFAMQGPMLIALAYYLIMAMWRE